MYDAVHLFAKALHDLDSSQRIDIKPLSCDAVDTWPHGYSLINYMKIVSIKKKKKRKIISTSILSELLTRVNRGIQIGLDQAEYQ